MGDVRPDPDPNASAVGEGGGPTVISETRAKQGRMNVPMFIVLAVSTLAAVVVMFGIWIAHGVGAGPSGGQSRAGAAAARSFNTPQSSPKQNPSPREDAANR